ncbi:hypothetical protein MRB53_039037 [Persea americana]|nr:hypothetical protein MRB53_039037 [Persea americana]
MSVIVINLRFSGNASTNLAGSQRPGDSSRAHCHCRMSRWGSALAIAILLARAAEAHNVCLSYIPADGDPQSQDQAITVLRLGISRRVLSFVDGNREFPILGEFQWLSCPATAEACNAYQPGPHSSSCAGAGSKRIRYRLNFLKTTEL